MKKISLSVLAAFFCLLIAANNVAAHCEIPCGIYDDQMRISMISEHITTIEKSMNQIMEMQKAKDHDANQLIRWVMNKENHANELQEIVSQYYMTQRIKFDAKDYDRKIGLLHQMLVYAMKCKQTTDLENIKKLREALQGFEALYFAK
jgi:nickel superoxide dismutase